MTEVVEKDFYQENFDPKLLDIFKTEEGEPYLTTPEGETIRVVSAEFKELLWKMYFQAHGGQEPSCCLVNKTIKKIYMFGRTLAPKKPIHRRVAKDNDAIVIDRCTPDGSVIKINGENSVVEQNAGTKFIRTKAQRKLSRPDFNAEPRHIELLKKYIPFKQDDD